jgi:hypothetical protein
MIPCVAVEARGRTAARLKNQMPAETKNPICIAKSMMRLTLPDVFYSITL